MTSYPVGNKTSLSRKPCIADKKLLLNTFVKSCSFIHFYNKTANGNFKNFSQVRLRVIVVSYTYGAIAVTICSTAGGAVLYTSVFITSCPQCKASCGL